MPEAYYGEAVARILESLRPQEDLWVFAIGSLIWKPRFPTTESRPAIIRGWHRAFCLGPDTRFRGNPSAPGLMLSLDRGGQCRGVVLRMHGEEIAASLEGLLRNEPPIPPRWVRAMTAQGPVRAIAFAIDRTHFRYAGRLSAEEVADRLSQAVGFVGSMPDYLLNTVESLRAAGIHDRSLWRMQALVAERLERMPAGRGSAR